MRQTCANLAYTSKEARAQSGSYSVADVSIGGWFLTLPSWLYQALMPMRTSQPTPPARLAAQAHSTDDVLPANLTFAFGYLSDPDALEGLWRDLEGRADGSFYLSWHWIGPWLSHIGRRPIVFRADVDGQIVALALLCSHTEVRHRFLRSRMLCLHETGDPACDVLTIEFNGILHDRRYGPALVERCLKEIAKSTPQGVPWDELLIGGVTDDFVPLAGRTGLALHIRDCRPSAAVPLDAIRASGRGHLAQLSANTRYQVRRAMKLYQQRGPLTIAAARDAGEARDFMAGLAELHQATWRARGKPGAFGADFFPKVHETMIAQSLASGAVEVLRVAAGQHGIGYLYNFIHRGWIGAYLSGFAYEDDPKLKPGLVCHCMAIDRHLAAGHHTYDFMAGDNRYKTSLGHRGPDMYWLSLRRPRLKLQLEDMLRAVKHRLRGA